MAKDITALYPAVEPELPSCPEPLILVKIREVLTEFCNETLVWSEELDSINIKTGVALYDLDGQQSNADIIIPVHVAKDDLELLPGRDYTMPSRTELELVIEPTEDAANTLDVTVALRPKEETTTICNDLYSDWWMTWAAGVKSKLMVMPKKKWTDLTMGARYNAEYWDGIAKAKIAVNRGKMAQQLRATPKYPFI